MDMDFKDQLQEGKVDIPNDQKQRAVTSSEYKVEEYYIGDDTEMMLHLDSQEEGHNSCTKFAVRNPDH